MPVDGRDEEEIEVAGFLRSGAILGTFLASERCVCAPRGKNEIERWRFFGGRMADDDKRSA